MQRQKRLSVMPFVIALIAVPIQGRAGNVDCLACHAADTISGASDFSEYYNLPPDGHSIFKTMNSNHSVGIHYPAALNAYQNFKQPNGHSTGIVFFDRNGNGQPDNDEVQLFATGVNGDFTVECSSCHEEHGNESGAIRTPGNSHLRINNKNSALCLICHDK